MSQNNNNKKTIAIIGAGPSGLCAAKSAIENGLKPTVFEKGNAIGGLWSNDEKVRKVWDSMHTNLTKYSVCFSDFPHKEDEEIEEIASLSPTKSTSEEIEDKFFQHHSKVYKYLLDYSTHFNLLEHIKFNTNITQIKRITITSNDKTDIKWEVNGDKMNLYDYLIISTGVFSKAQGNCNDLIEKLKSQGFNGRISFSEDYKDNNRFKDKKVVVLGTSFSACDIASEISNISNKCIQVGHDNKWVIKRVLPTSESTIAPLDLIFFNRSRSIINKTLQLKDVYIKRHKYYSTTMCKYQNQEITPDSKIPVNFDSGKPSHSIISSTYVDNIINGKITAYTGNGYTIDSSNGGNSITFKNDRGESKTEDNIDEIILCNGYKLDLSFLEEDILKDINYDPTDSFQPICLYKNIFPPNIKNLAFIALYRGPFFSEIELFSRWASMLFAGKLQFPTNDEIQQDLNIQLNKRNQLPHPQFPITDFVNHCDEIAALIGCLPNFNDIEIQDPQLYEMLINSFYCNASYRLVGDNSNPELAKKTITKYYNLYKQFILNK